MTEKDTLEMFIMKLLKIFGLERDEVTGKWGKSHSEERRNL